MSSAEYTQWRAAYHVRPFGERALDLRLAHMLACHASFVDGKSHRASEFDPFPDPRTPTPMDAEHMRDIFKGITKKMDGTFKSWQQAQ